MAAHCLVSNCIIGMDLLFVARFIPDKGISNLFERSISKILSNVFLGRHSNARHNETLNPGGLNIGGPDMNIVPWPTNLCGIDNTMNTHFPSSVMAKDETV